jgi:hypothetical protein
MKLCRGLSFLTRQLLLSRLEAVSSVFENFHDWSLGVLLQRGSLDSWFSSLKIEVSSLARADLRSAVAFEFRRC